MTDPKRADLEALGAAHPYCRHTHAAIEEIKRLRELCDQRDAGWNRALEALGSKVTEVGKMRAEVERWRQRASQLEIERDELRAEVERLKKAVAFARCTIKSGEPWTDTCEDILQ